MADVLLAPDLLLAEEGDKSLGGGAASTLAAVQDSNDATYVLAGDNNPVVAGGAWSAVWRMADHAPSIPAGAIIDKVRVELRSIRPNINEQMYAHRITTVVTGETSYPTGFETTERPNQTVDSTIRDYIGPWRTQDSQGRWFHDVVGTGKRFAMGAAVWVKDWVWPYPGVSRLHYARLRVSWNEKPTATANAPTGAQATARPVVAWSYNDAEADPQEAYQIKVFTAAQYGAGGFNPDTSPATWDSGKRFGSVANATIGADLLNGGTYRAYVRVWQPNVAGRTHYSDWSFSGFTVSMVVPATPTLTATVEQSSGRIRINLQGDPAYATQTIILERSLDGGLTWSNFRGTPLVDVAGTTPFVLYDNEAPWGTTVSYRARTYRVSGINVLTSANTATQTGLLPLSGAKYWLKDLVDATLSRQVRVTKIDFTRHKPMVVDYPVGSTEAAVSHDGLKSPEIDIAFMTQNKTEYDDLMALLTLGRTLLLQDVLGRQWYVQVGDTVKEMQLRSQPSGAGATTVRHLHEIELTFISVRRPVT